MSADCLSLVWVGQAGESRQEVLTLREVSSTILVGQQQPVEQSHTVRYPWDLPE